MYLNRLTVSLKLIVTVTVTLWLVITGMPFSGLFLVLFFCVDLSNLCLLRAVALSYNDLDDGGAVRLLWTARAS